MKHITGVARDQALLFPEVVEEYIREDNAVRFIEAFVDGMELDEKGFERVEAKATGRPGYDPADLLKLYIYGYLNRLRSSRLLEKEAHRNVEVMWLMKKLTPDFKTIAEFRRKHPKAIKEVCKEFTLLCARLELFGGELLAVDGSKFAAVNANGRNFTEKKLKKLIRQVEEKVEAYLKNLDEPDRQEPVSKTLSKEELELKIKKVRDRKTFYEDLLKELEQSGSTQVSLTDAESRMMKSAQGRDVCYNVQSVVDARHKLIVEHEVTNAPNDRGELSKMALKAQQTLGINHAQVVADTGYYNGQEIKKCLDAGLTPYVPKAQAADVEGVYPKERFIYDSIKDSYRCPAGEELTYRSSGQMDEGSYRAYTTQACSGCAMRAQCTRGKILA